MAIAYEVYQRSLCPCGCGFPRDRSWSGDLDGGYEVREHQCHARAARERWEADQAKIAADQREHGILAEVIDTTLE